MILPADGYIVINKSIITEEDKKILIDLYQPIIGSKAISLYFTLLNEIEKNEVMTQELTHHRLQKRTQLSLEKISSAREILEAIGLLKTYIKKEKINHLVYILYSPLKAQEFFTHPILNIVLYNNLGKEEYERTVSSYKMPKINLKDYEDVTASFNKVFASVPGTSYINNQDIISTNYGKINVKDVIDFELLSASLTNIVNEKTLTKDVKDLINNLCLVYNLDVLTIKDLIINSVKENGYIDKESLRKECRNYYKFENDNNLPTLIYKKQPEYLKSPIGDPSKKAELIYIFENTSCYNFIKSKYKDGKVLERDLRLIENLLVDLKLNPGVVNVLLDYVLKTNNQKLSKAYVETIASNWKRLGIETVQEAMDACIKEHKKKKSITTIKQETKDIIPEWFNNNTQKKEIKAQEQEELKEILKRYE